MLILVMDRQDMTGLASTSDARKEVMEQIARSEKRLYATELGRLLGKSQVAVFKNLQPLLEAKLLVSNQESRGGPQWLSLTHKGAFAILSGIRNVTLDTLVSNHSYLFDETDKNQRALIKAAMSERFANIYYQTVAELALRLDLFTPDGAFILSGKGRTGETAKRYGFYFDAVLMEITFRLKEAAEDMKKGEYLHWQKWFDALEKNKINTKQMQMVIQQ